VLEAWRWGGLLEVGWDFAEFTPQNLLPTTVDGGHFLIGHEFCGVNSAAEFAPQDSCPNLFFKSSLQWLDTNSAE